MILGALIILLAISITIVVVETIEERKKKKEKKERTEQYIDLLERTVLDQERSLRYYRFKRYMEDTKDLIEKE